MEVDEGGSFTFEGAYSKLISSLWYMKVEGYETLLREIIDYDPKSL